MTIMFKMQSFNDGSHGKLWKSHILLLILCVLIVTSCNMGGNVGRSEVAREIKSFFGDSVLVLKSSNKPNGYQISIIRSKDLCLCHFERGDSINQYFAIHKLPMNLSKYENDSIGVYSVKMDFPVLKIDTLGGSKETPDMFFMDVNFDGEEEFVVEHEGYNRVYYACFDLVNGNYKTASPGLLESIQDEPYNNIVSFGNREPSYTVFDYKKKEIYIYESMGCCSYQETWAKCFPGNSDEFRKSCVKVIKRIDHDSYADGTTHIDTYMLKNDTLKLVKKEVK